MLKNTWKNYVAFEEKHTENIEGTIKFFNWVLDTFVPSLREKDFQDGLEIGTGLSGGYLPLLRIKNKVAVDYVHGPLKMKAENLEYPDNSFDVVIISNTLDHCEDPQKVAQEIERVLRPNGIMFIFNYFDEDENHPWSWSHSDEITSMFKNLKITFLANYPRGKRNAFMVATLQK